MIKRKDNIKFNIYLSSKIINLLLNEAPLTYYKIGKKLNMDTTKVRYHLKKLINIGVVIEFNRNNKKQYAVSDEKIVGYRGMLFVFIDNTFITYNCPYRGECRKENCGKNCKLLREGPEFLKNILKSYID